MRAGGGKGEQRVRKGKGGERAYTQRATRTGSGRQNRRTREKVYKHKASNLPRTAHAAVITQRALEAMLTMYRQFPLKFQGFLRHKVL